MSYVKFQHLSGFRDFLPEKMRLRQKTIETMRQVFESFGFEPLETPALEYAATLLGKYGQEADRLVYQFEDFGERQVALRYDLTVPLARVLAENQNLPLPFKRYQIQPVWRGESPQFGRFREFWQADIDIVGSDSVLADAEIVSLIFTVLQKLGLSNFKIRINSRQFLFNLLDQVGVGEKDSKLSFLRSIDKLDKRSKVEIEEELRKKGFGKIQIADFFHKVGEKKDQTLSMDRTLNGVFDLLPKFGIPSDFYEFSPFLSRGLDYYTGLIFEVAIETPKIGSIAGGGRYDELMEKFTGRKIPAVGVSFGLDRICEAFQVPGSKFQVPGSKVLVAVFPSESPEGRERFLQKSIETVKFLRGNGIAAEFYLGENEKLDKQIRFADRKGIQYVIIIGEEKVCSGRVTFKDLETGQQQTLSYENLLGFFKGGKSRDADSDWPSFGP